MDGVKVAGGGGGRWEDLLGYCRDGSMLWRVLHGRMMRDGIWEG